MMIYGTKTGVELTSLGIPVIVAGEAWIRNKGLTTRRGLGGGLLPDSGRLPFRARMPESVQRARKYAYHFFFRRMIPIDR